MAYKKKNKGAGLLVQKIDNLIEISCNYFDKWVTHSADLDKQETKIMVGYHNHPGMFGKPVKWKSEWLKTKFIDNVQKVGNETWYISIDSYSARVNIERTVSGIHIGEDFKNIIKAKFVAKVASKINSYIKQERDLSIIPHYDNADEDNPRMSLRPDVLISCIKAVTEEFPHLDPNTDLNNQYEYRNVFDFVASKEPELEDLPF